MIKTWKRVPTQSMARSYSLRTTSSCAIFDVLVALTARERKHVRLSMSLLALQCYVYTLGISVQCTLLSVVCVCVDLLVS